MDSDKMLYLFCAMRCEALPVIEAYGLSNRFKCPGGTTVFLSDDGRTILALTGMGKTSMSYAAGEVFALYPPDETSAAVNVGVCAGKGIGDTFLVSKVTDHDTGRDLYPDILYETGLKTSSLVTVSRFINDGIEDDRLLYDMEGSAFAEACISRIGCARTCLIKIVSDMGDGANLTEDKVRDLVRGRIDIIRHVTDVYSGGVSRSEMCESEPDIGEYAELFRCSETMRNEIMRLLRYSLSSRIDMPGMIEKMRKEGLLPVASRKDGKEMLNVLRRRIIYSKL